MSEAVTYLVAQRHHGRYFGDLLASLEAQTDPRWFCLVCDDGSTDDSAAVIRARVAASPARERLRLLVNAENLGKPATLRRLMAETETDIVAILDGDDALMPEATAALLAAYAADPDAAFVHARHADYDAALAGPLGARGEAVPPDATSLQAGFVGHLWSFRRSAYARTAGWDETCLVAEDRDLVYKLEEVTRPVFVDRILYKRRVLPGSQDHDPVLRRLGHRNHVRARGAALRRRGVRGWRYALAVLFFWLRESPPLLRPALRPLASLLSAFGRRRVVPVGRLRRAAQPSGRS